MIQKYGYGIDNLAESVTEFFFLLFFLTRVTFIRAFRISMCQRIIRNRFSTFFSISIFAEMKIVR